MHVIGISGLDNSVSFKRRELPGLEARAYRFAQGFDSAAALVSDERVVAAVAEERFTGEKSTGAFPRNAILFCLEEAGIDPADVGHVAHAFAYRRLPSQPGSYSERRFEQVYAPDVTAARVEELFPGWGERFVSVPHHLAHAASAFDLSGFDDALVLVADGMGEIESLSVATADPESIRILRRYSIGHSLGILYSVFTLYLGFEPMMDEYKVMGLAPYGDPERYRAELDEVIRLRDDGWYDLPLLARNKTADEWETHGGAVAGLIELFGPAREPGAAVETRHRDVAAAAQVALERAMFHVLEYFRAATGSRRLCLAGGVALNCTFNGLVADRGLFDDLFVQPAAADDGSALGAALHVSRSTRNRPPARMRMPYWGPPLRRDAIEAALAERGDCLAYHYEDFAELAAATAERLDDGAVVAWAQGRLEFGPRALGNRSILGDPREARMRDHINELIKQREEFRPFAPAVTAESARTYFAIPEGLERAYAHMLLVAQTRDEHRDRLQAVTHVDGSARVQVVDESDNSRFWRLLKEFERVTGLPVLLNTSFNLKGQPIVADAATALETFIASNLDVLVIGDYFVTPRSRRESGPAPFTDAAQAAYL